MKVIAKRNDAAFRNGLSEFQCGLIAGRLTIDHMKLQAIIIRNKSMRQGTYVVFRSAENVLISCG